MVADVKYRKSPLYPFEQWKDIPETQIYWLSVLQKIDGKFYLKMQWEGTNPQRGIDHILHYASCQGCQQNSTRKGGHAVFLFCNSRFVYGFDLRNIVALSHEKDYTSYLRGLINRD